MLKKQKSVIKTFVKANIIIGFGFSFLSFVKCQLLNFFFYFNETKRNLLFKKLFWITLSFYWVSFYLACLRRKLVKKRLYFVVWSLIEKIWKYKFSHNATNGFFLVKWRRLHWKFMKIYHFAIHWCT